MMNFDIIFFKKKYFLQNKSLGTNRMNKNLSYQNNQLKFNSYVIFICLKHTYEV